MPGISLEITILRGFDMWESVSIRAAGFPPLDWIGQSRQWRSAYEGGQFTLSGVCTSLRRLFGRKRVNERNRDVTPIKDAAYHVEGCAR